MKTTHSKQNKKTRIPERVYFRIGEVSSLVGVDTHVLRYWESEFKVIKPRRAKSKQRLYRKKDVENLLRIRALLHDEGYTIAGARRLLKSPGRKKSFASKKLLAKKPNSDQNHLDEIKQELEEILQQISSP